MIQQAPERVKPIWIVWDGKWKWRNENGRIDYVKDGAAKLQRRSFAHK